MGGDDLAEDKTPHRPLAPEKYAAPEARDAKDAQAQSKGAAASARSRWKHVQEIVLPPQKVRKEASLFSSIEETDVARLNHLRRGDGLGWRMLWAFEGTVFPDLIKDPLFIFCLAFYTATRASVLLSDTVQTDDDANFQGVTILGAAVTFFLVFYTGHTFTRYQAQYFAAMEASKALVTFTLQAKAFLKRPRVLRLVRRMNAANMVAYVSLSTVYDFNVLKHWNEKYKVLTKNELAEVQEVVQDNDGSPDGLAVILNWIVGDLEEAVQTKETAELRCHILSTTLMQFKDGFERLFHYRDQQLPFFYVHLTVIFSWVYLPLLSTVLAISPVNPFLIVGILWETQNFAALVVSCIFVLGLRITSQHMSDPFGDDTYDFPVLQYSLAGLIRSRKILHANQCRFPSVGSEENMMNGAAAEQDYEELQESILGESL